ncbi:hypothetical protein F1654_02025 [Alkalicaulis satelles]|uniref:DUF4345 domain-containing protein n=1 Tax=Alkalicaulis satelles TaxID=2609175 RepID=A0A5M6ZKE1_9PROT|nr:hypothetical protein [Alkalicaulis satelles]KAA5804800.1 hypothetical protein F1654_02025 [Alkalicaulis satelles]
MGADFPISWMIAALAALIGTGMGILSLAVPRWGASVVRLAPDPRWKGGYAEFRASYGGAIALAHGAVLLTLAMSAQAGSGAVMGASFAVGLYWGGMAIGRAMSMVMDRQHETVTGYNAGAIVFEAAMALALAAPFIAHLG